MIKYLLSILYLLVFSIIVIYNYYFVFGHIEKSDFFSQYLIIISLLLFVYSIWISFKKYFLKIDISYNVLSLIGFGCINLIIASIFYFYITFSINGGNEEIILKSIGNGWNLFFLTFSYLLLPLILVLLFLSFGRFILKKIIKTFSSETIIFQFISSLGIGFFIFSVIISILSFVSLFNLYGISFVILFLFIFSYKEVLYFLKGLIFFKIKIPQFKNDYSFWIYFVSTILLFSIITFLISVNLINIVRPSPIGWDDMGVYMNFPNLISTYSNSTSLGGMLSWQVFTGIGYLTFGSIQAFFLNNLGGILSIIIITLSFTDLLKNSKKTFINIPLLASGIFLSMPMIIFQQAKDMKLDTSLFFLGSIIIYMLFYLIIKYFSNKSEVEGEETIITSFKFNLKKDYIIYFFIIGLLLGLTFTIKITSLLLISGIFGVIFYLFFGYLGFLGYLGLYFGIFSFFNLWGYLNVVGISDLENIKTIGIVFIIIGFIFLLLDFLKNNLVNVFKKFLIVILTLFIGIFAGVFPWVVKNIITAKSISINAILNGETERFSFDLNKIYTSDEIKKIDKNYENLNVLDKSGVSGNEDWGRYLGYEKGINNYVKFPFNLTMQVNQRGEFTDITYIFFALIPLLLFFYYKKNYLVLGILLFVSLFLIFFEKNIILLFKYYYYYLFNTASYKEIFDGGKIGFINVLQNPGNLEFLKFNYDTSLIKFFTTFFGNYNFPIGYIIIFLLFFVPFSYLLFTLDKKEKSIIVKLSIVFGVFYIFLWSISSFGVVWYGINMYYILLILIALGIYNISSFDENDTMKVFSFKAFGSIIVFFIITFYFFLSSIPHGLNNIKDAGFFTFKNREVGFYGNIFNSQGSDNFRKILELNIKNDKQKLFIKDLLKDTRLNEFLISQKILSDNGDFTGESILDFINNLKNLKNYIVSNLNNPELKKYLQTMSSNPNTFKEFNSKIADLKSNNKKIDNALENIYKNILYPKKEYINNGGIYKIGTFLTYYTANNNKRLYDDGLLFTFDKYIYDKNIDKGVERMKKLGFEYFLVDLNTATIDRDYTNHKLTNRYENVLETLTSDKLELINSDSVCLNLALEEYSHSLKSDEKLKDFKNLAGVNYESFSSNGNIINRGQKLMTCKNIIASLIQSGDYEKFASIKDLGNYYKNQLEREKEKYKGENKNDVFDEKTFLINVLNQFVQPGKSVLFKIKN